MPQKVIFRWDLDKTYLKTDFDSLRGLVRIPFESAQDKIAAPGVATLIRGLRSSAARRGAEVRVLFLSGSPPQIGKAIREKLAMDGIEHDGITFKDQWGRIRRGRFRELREQVGYKLTELLRARSTEPPGAAEYLFGDDWESDPLIYSLYADVITGVLGQDELRRILVALRVAPDLALIAGDLMAKLHRGNTVMRIFINLARQTAPRQLDPYGPRLVPTFNYLQTAACLYEEGVLDMEAMATVVNVLRDENDYDTRRLVNSLRDIERRRHLSEAGAALLARHLSRASVLPELRRGRSRWRDLWLRCRQRLVPDELAAARGRPDYARIVPALAPEAPEEAQP